MPRTRVEAQGQTFGIWLIGHAGLPGAAPPDLATSIGIGYDSRWMASL